MRKLLKLALSGVVILEFKNYRELGVFSDFLDCKNFEE